MARSEGVRLITTSIYLSLVGLTTTQASVWLLSDNVRGQALLWITWSSVLGAFVAFPVALLIVDRCGSGRLERRV